MTAPVTGFEASGDTTWTTLAQETAFLTAVTTGSTRAAMTTLGTSTNGTQPIRQVTVQTATTPVDAPAVLFIGLQHGNEPAGREMVLKTLRDLAFTDDPTLLALLDRCRFHFIPAANPSGFPTSRTVPSSGGTNMNREHLSLDVVESRILQRAITDVQPVLVLDAHEFFGTTNPHEVWLGGGQQPQGDSQVNALSLELQTDLRATLTGQSIPNGLYPTTSPGTMRTVAALRLAVFMLIETPAQDDITAPAVRVTWQVAVRDRVLSWLNTNFDRVVGAAHGARVRKATEGAAATAPFDLDNGTVLRPPPSAYKSTADLSRWLDTFGIEHQTAGAKVTVPMAQAAQPLLPYLFDRDSGDQVAAAIRIYRPTRLGAPIDYRVRNGVHRQKPIAVKIRTDGATVQVWP